MAIPMDRERLHEKNRKLIYFIRKDHDVCGTLYLYLLAIGGFKGGGKGACPQQQVPGDAIWRLYNARKLLAAGAPPHTPLWELTALPRTP